jgi:hypothetical protein
MVGFSPWGMLLGNLRRNMAFFRSLLSPGDFFSHLQFHSGYIAFSELL